LGIIFAVFDLEMIISFLFEGTPQADQVMGGGISNFVIIWGMWFFRFVFNKQAS